MKKTILIVAISFISIFSEAKKYTNIPNYDLEMTSREYQKLIGSQAISNIETMVTENDAEDIEINKWLAIGKRNLQWVDLVNSHRTEANKISLSSKATQGGIPVSNPKSYNFQIIQESWQTVQDLIPMALKDVIFNNSTMTEKIPVSDREFLEWLYQVDRNYQMTSRYKLMKPYKTQMAERISSDVRGFLNLKNDI